jgi:hypothetical protein
MTLKNYCIALAVAIVLLSTVAFAQTRAEERTGDMTGRDAVGFRKDKVTKETVGERNNTPRSPSTSQVIEDFRLIQELNYKLRDTTKLAPLAFEEIAVTAKKIREVAGRLKVSLALPKPKEKSPFAPPQSDDELLKQVGEINAHIKAFVTNPIFSSVTEAGKDLPMEAGINLNKVIEMTKALEQGANHLRRSIQQNQ